MATIKLSPAASAILSYFVQRQSKPLDKYDTANVFYSDDHLRQTTHYHRKTIYNALHELEDRGIITIISRGWVTING